MELGKNIKMYRQEARLSQEELADRIYVSARRFPTGKTIKAIPM